MTGTPEVAAQTAPAGTTTARAPVTVRPDRASAILTARLQNARVAVESETTESSLTYANPDGSLTVEAASGVVRVREDGQWVPVDTTLVESGGVFRPKAAKAQVEFSAGGADAPLAAIAQNPDKRFGLRWPSELPTPQVAGNIATYPGVDGEGGTDLVVTALPTGFRFDLVVRQRPTGDLRFTFPVEARGLKLGEAAGGTLELTDDEGELAAAAPKPVMYDSPATASESGPVRSGPLSVKVESRDGGQVLVLEPDMAFLTDPATRYPVTVDPTITLPVTTSATVYSGTGISTNGSLDVGNHDIRWEDFSSERRYSRALLGFDTSQLVGKTVVDARLELRSPGGEARSYQDYMSASGPTITRTYQCTYPAWSNLTQYSSGSRVSRNNRHWEANKTTWATPTSSSADWWDLGECPSSTTTGPRTEPSMSSGNWGCGAVQIQARQITAAWNSGVGWSGKPATTPVGAQVATDPTGCSGSSPSQPALWRWQVTDIAKAWAAGAAGHGLSLQLAAENTSVSPFERLFDSPSSYGADVRPPMLSVTYALPPEAGPLVTWPSVTAADGTVQATSVTPQLQARFTDDGIVRRVEFDLEHDPSAVTQGTGQIWSGAVDGVQGNGPALVSMPAGKLLDGWKVRWRARAFDGAAYSAWTAWQNVTVAAAAGATGVTCPDYPAGQWSPVKSGPATCTVTLVSGGAVPFTWGLDDPATSQTGKGTGSATLQISPLQGWHTLYVKVGRNAVAAHSFGVGDGALLQPGTGTHTRRSVTLAATARPTWTGVRYQYRTDLSASGPWAAVPAADVTPPGGGAPLTSWPFTRTDPQNPFMGLVWNVAATLVSAGRPPGPVEVRPCFMAAGTADACGPARLLFVDEGGFGESEATAALGPGSVSLLTGDLSVGATDASVGGLGVSRTHTTLKPYTEQGAAGVFGPGWSAAFPAQSGRSSHQFDDHSAEGYVQLVGPGRVISTYLLAADGSFRGVGDAKDGSRIFKRSANEFVYIGPDDSTTTWVKNAGGRWTVSTVETPASESTASYVIDASGRYSRLLAPPPTDVTCTGTLVTGCRALDITYASTTTATGVSSGWGDYTGLVKQLTYVAADPAGVMRSTVVATYQYDSTGHLRKVTDALTGLAVVYYYTGQGRLSQITPPGVEPVRIEYDTAGRVAHTARTTPQGESVQAVAYGVPLTGAAAPVDLSAAQTATWGQVEDLPVTGAALFPASHVPPRAGDGSYVPGAADWPYAGLAYLDAEGRPVNGAAFGAGGWQVSSTRYDDRGNTIWELTARNRALALNPTAEVLPFVAAQPDPAARANLLASVNTYNADSDQLTHLDPAAEVTLDSGRVVAARVRTSYIYDEGKPVTGTDEFGVSYADKDWHLGTTTKMEPVILDGDTSIGAADVSLSKNGYDPVQAGDPSGWKLRKATTSTVVMNGQSDLVQKYRYDSSGRVIESRGQGSNGNDAGTTVWGYYTAGANSAYPACANKPQWAGLVCQIGPKAQPAGPPLATTKKTYTYYLQPATVTETAGTTVRTSTSGYDTTGRLISRTLTVTPQANGGTPVPGTTFGYDAATGLPTQVSAGGKSVVTGYDTLGRPVSYTDATGNVTVTGYDLDGRVASVNDGKGTTIYGYDGDDALGRPERRGLLTSVQTSVGTFQAGYDQDGRLDLRTYPNGLWAGDRYDSTGRRTGLAYGMDRTNWSPWLQFTEQVDADGQTTGTTSPGGLRRYRYDLAGRLMRVQETPAGGACTTRVYQLDVNSNRTGLSTYPAAVDGSCSTTTTPMSEQHTYDTADRLTDAGYGYDNLGRTLTVPGGQVGGGTALTAAYYANDRIATLTQGSRSQTFTLDPAGRIDTTVVTGGPSSGTVVNHYSGAGDTPAWISESDGSWTRNLEVFGGLAAVQSPTDTKLQIADMGGDIVATVANDPAATGVDSYAEFAEYGSPAAGGGATQRYGWQGEQARPSDGIGGLVLMGARVYNPAVGRFLQVDPIRGGSANNYEYSAQDPVNNGDAAGMSVAKKPKKKKKRGNGQACDKKSSLGTAVIPDISRLEEVCYRNWDNPCDLEDFRNDVHDLRDEKMFGTKLPDPVNMSDKQTRKFAVGYCDKLNDAIKDYMKTEGQNNRLWSSAGLSASSVSASRFGSVVACGPGFQGTSYYGLG
ncbi:RHS repeat-associated core domain-containing protein [Sphaerisporangium sp. B11E5]|uniref:RHS repeat-associated core domain-containing protein n=1 Tax=Sphaerisporangium sp. B11E5 TaxID=3153563 RepID=UPI00325E75D2